MGERKKTIVVTSGGTSEPIDGVRKITNSGTGRLGAEIAAKFMEENEVEQVIYIHTKNAYMPISGYAHKLTAIPADSVTEVRNAVENALDKNKVDIFIHSMAISDYMVDYVSTPQLLGREIGKNFDPHADREHRLNMIQQIIRRPSFPFTLDRSGKISSDEDNLMVMLVKAPKIISMIKRKSPDTILVGFKLLENANFSALLDAANRQIKENGCDYVVANDLRDISAEQHVATLINHIGKPLHTTYTKSELAARLADVLLAPVHE